jgi:hypothetical protein
VIQTSGNGGFGGGAAQAARLAPDAAVVVVAIWLVGALAIACIVTERAEIGG